MLSALQFLPELRSLMGFCCYPLCSPGKYHDLECQLIQEFTSAQRRGEISRMREVAAVLLHFKVKTEGFNLNT